MDTRLILQIVLGTIIALVVILGGLMIYSLTRDAETVIVEDLVDETRTTRERRNPWADQGDAAIALVGRVAVANPPGDAESMTVQELMENDDFVTEKLKITTGERQGWTAQWWGETRFGPSFYLVRYGFLDENISVGPSWLVDLQSQKVVPKNVLAQVTNDPERGVKSDYYDQANQVVAAITNHRFPSGINLGGALLKYFEERHGEDEADKVLGWTVDHDMDELYQAYFQWIERGEATYASFEFDFDKRALRAVNLQAHEIMRAGEEFDPVEKVSIMPRTYDPNERVRSRRWQGAARNQCSDSKHRDGCRALATVLDDAKLIETLEWLLTVDGDSSEEFKRCRVPRDGEPRPACLWRPMATDDGYYRIQYEYRLDGEPHQIAWNVFLNEEKVVPVDLLSELAYRAVHPRG